MKRLARLVLALAPIACGSADPPPKVTAERPVAQPTAAPAVPALPTFAEHVAPIVYAHCTTCHHTGGPAPFALTTYDDVHDHAAQIAEVTTSGYMPPWLPRPDHGEFVGARRLDAPSRATLARWAASGAPAGDLSRAPAPPVHHAGWQLGEPDLVLDTGPAYTLRADGQDIYRNFVIPVPPGPLRHVRALEIQPINARVVHHGVLRVDLGGSVRRLDAEDPAPGFDGMVFAGALMPDGRFLGYTPGKLPDPGSDARSWRLHGGSDLVLQLHLRPSGKPEPVQAKIGLYFAKRPATRPALAMELVNSDIDLPAGARDVHVRDQFTMPLDVAITSVYPHAHYLGKRLEAWAMLPDGSREWLIAIDDWDFNWQDQYQLVAPLRLPRGSTIHMDWSFDNSAQNPHNQFSPPRRVVHGPASTDEMAELILEVEPEDPRDLAALDEAFRRKWLMGQVARLERTLARAPDDVEAAVNLGAFRQLLGEPAAAISAYERALQREPDHVRANIELGIVLMASGQLPRALPLLRRAVKLAPRDARPHLVLGNALRKHGDASGAIVQYREAIAIDDSLAEAHNNLGIVLEGRGELEAAAAAFARAQALDARQPLYASNLARVRAQLGR
ncbi:MAG: tetratricopeptide repeat protein [Nannocystis sp.]|nr:tetratricopeptide repeat protein [Nannocystis sp.]MBA3547204.1 tetratricopeptide repeat protein [Nannocystis sp.]